VVYFSYTQEPGVKIYIDQIDKEEYEVLKFAYEEWAKISKLIAGFAFASIGFLIATQSNLQSLEKITAAQQDGIVTAFYSFSAAGLLAGLNICVAYIWMDAIRRNHKTSLIGKTVVGNYPNWCLRLGAVGWILAVFAIGAIIFGVFQFAPSK
jgi:hypothetical protein